MRHVDATYRTIARREARAVGGLSMGGHGAVQLALTYPDLFGVAGVHSPSIRGRDSAPAYFGSDEAAFARRDPISLVRDADLAAPPSIWIDVGEDDPWRPGAEALRQALDRAGAGPTSGSSSPGSTTAGTGATTCGSTSPSTGAPSGSWAPPRSPAFPGSGSPAVEGLRLLPRGRETRMRRNPLRPPSRLGHH